MKWDVVLDTDAFNEIDDQYALAYLLASDCCVRAIYAAPFLNKTVQSPAEGMAKSYAEVVKILSLTGKKNIPVFLGSEKYLPSDTEFVESQAARHLVELSREYSSEKRLQVVSIGAITNVASAILMDPSICDRIRVIWLGGNMAGFWSPWEFNLQQDPASARVIFGSKVPVVSLPCGGVVAEYRTTSPELHYWLDNQNPVCDYLLDMTEFFMSRGEAYFPWSRVLWDVVAVAYLFNEDNCFMRTEIKKAPYVPDDLKITYPENGKDIECVFEIFRDKIYQDMVRKLRTY